MDASPVIVEIRVAIAYCVRDLPDAQVFPALIPHHGRSGHILSLFVPYDHSIKAPVQHMALAAYTSGHKNWAVQLRDIDLDKFRDLAEDVVCFVFKNGLRFAPGVPNFQDMRDLTADDSVGNPQSHGTVPRSVAPTVRVTDAEARAISGNYK